MAPAPVYDLDSAFEAVRRGGLRPGLRSLSERFERSQLIPIALHIPDGFLSGEIALLMAIPAIAAVAYGLKVADRDLDESRIPLLGVVGAFVFAVQMLNFPVAGGTSGHLLGATLAAVLLGPWLACLVMAVVLTVQCFAFADGGVTALGANVLNMGVLGAILAGFLLGAAVRAFAPDRATFLARVAGVSGIAVIVAATATSLQLALSDTIPLGTSLPAMLGVHALIGIGEAVITVAAVSAVLATRPDLVALGRFPDPGPRATPQPSGGVR